MSNQELEDFVKSVQSKEDFTLFLGYLSSNLKTNQDMWENNNLSSYLNAMQSWTEDSDGYYLNNNLPIPKNVNWKVFVDILMAGRIYE